MSRRLIAACAGLVLLTSTDLAGQDCPELVGDWPAADVYSVAATGDFAYIGGNRKLLIADVSDPSAPRVVGDVQLPDDAWAHDVAVLGSHAYVAAFYAGLLVIDVGTPSAPRLVGRVATPYAASSVAVSGSYAYFTDWHSLRIIDVTTPSEPVEVGLIDTPRPVRSIAVSGS
jgi:hypothetical protein